MIAKKNPRLDLERKRLVIFPLGLLAMTAGPLAAFTYHSPLDYEREKLRVAAHEIDYRIQEQEQEEDKQDVVVQMQTNNQNQSNNQQSDPSLPSNQVSDQSPIVDNDPNAKPVSKVGLPSIGNLDGIGIQKVDRDPVKFPDKDAAYVGGYGEMQHFITKTVVYPEESVQIGEQGVVYVRFIVEEDGSITNISIIKGVSPALDREAKRVVKHFPKWIPGEVKAEPVRTYVEMPIRFILD